MSGHVPVFGSEEVFPSKESAALSKTNEGQFFSAELRPNESSGNGGQAFQGFEYGSILPDEDVSFGDSFFAKDDLLQGNGLSWAFELDVQMGEGKEAQNAEDTKFVKEEAQGHKEVVVLTPENLAFKIEAELFKLFGDVNKKYREKGRSLLFNLKDRNNPDLRERVMSGEISPERLCSMSAEELASKELSEWRMAKAEEFAQMVVLPDTEVDIRRLVKKTHKGEYQVEVEHDDVIVAEISSGTSSTMLTQRQPKKETVPHSPSKASLKDKEKVAGQGSSSEDQDFSGSLIIQTDGTDLMQGMIVDELKDAEFLPPIVSLDEFMESLNNEPPFENLSVDAGQKIPLSHGESPKLARNSRASNRASNSPKDASSNKAGVFRKHDVTTKSSRSPAKQNVLPSIIPKIEYIWDGTLQLNISSSVAVGGLFQSGEKTSMKEWPSSLEIKGRVRLDAFEKFLQELHMSRTRAVMVYQGFLLLLVPKIFLLFYRPLGFGLEGPPCGLAWPMFSGIVSICLVIMRLYNSSADRKYTKGVVLQFVLKDKSSENQRANLSEAIDSYVTDERLGYAEPAPGVELYLCPPTPRITDTLNKLITPKENPENNNTIENRLIGVVVWRRAHISNTISPNSSSHHKHSSKKQAFPPPKRVRDSSNVNPNTPTRTSSPVFNKQAEPQKEDDDDDDIPPGFARLLLLVGQGQKTMIYRSSIFHHLFREFHHKICIMSGNSLTNRVDNRGSIGIEPWNDDDDDDIPEWRPQAPPPQLPPYPVAHGQRPPQHMVPVVTQQPPSGLGHPAPGGRWVQPPGPLRETTVDELRQCKHQWQHHFLQLNSTILSFQILPSLGSAAEEELKMDLVVDDINAYSYLYPTELPTNKFVFKWVESRKPERYSSAAPLSQLPFTEMRFWHIISELNHTFVDNYTADARLRIVSERVDFIDNLIISVSIVPPNSLFLKSEDKNTWSAKDVADSVLADKSALRVTSSQRMDESSVLDAHSSTAQESNLYRHFVASTAARDGYLYTLSASTLSKQWSKMGPFLEKTVASFRLIPPTENYVPPYKDPWRFW
ncbi:hypothetical protein DH2020_046791 [Rehmannia glutinosa]|uniref:TFIIS central domain-containing protein n=1 Tax=Rehmannia glutinosa TaxID=99300 RepID=A0ABR0UB53_REHGL